MAYKVLNTFREKEHDDHVYQKDDSYPVEGYKATKKRVEFLQKKNEEYDGMVFLETPKEKEDDKEEKQESGKKSSDKK